MSREAGVEKRVSWKLMEESISRRQGESWCEAKEDQDLAGAGVGSG